jgi:hypothetical protein
MVSSVECKLRHARTGETPAHIALLMVDTFGISDESSVKA